MGVKPLDSGRKSVKDLWGGIPGSQDSLELPDKAVLLREGSGIPGAAILVPPGLDSSPLLHPPSCNPEWKTLGLEA